MKKQYKDIETNLERIKWYLWHGNVFQALQLIDSLVFDLEIFKDEDTSAQKLWNSASEFQTYINNNGNFDISMVKRFQPGLSNQRSTKSLANVWSKNNRCDGQRRERIYYFKLEPRSSTTLWFCRWYPQMKTTEEEIQRAA